MNILVTGGAGYIGSAVCHHLARAGHQLVVLDDLRAGDPSRLPPGTTLVQADIGCRNTLNQILPGIQGVLHFAANIDVAGSMTWPMRHFQNNVSRTLALLQAMLDHRVDKFVFSSTAAIYGQPVYLPVDEEHPTAPENPYGESKLMVEQTLAWLHRQNGLRYASLRYFNAAGGRPGKHAVNLIPLVLEVARGVRPHLAIYGDDYATPDGTAVRDYIHIEDLATAHVMALDALEHSYPLIFNVGTGQGYSVNEVVAAARRVTQKEIPTVVSPRRAGDVAEMVACSRKIRERLGWRPEVTSLDAIVSSAWAAITAPSLL